MSPIDIDRRVNRVEERLLGECETNATMLVSSRRGVRRYYRITSVE